MSEPLSNTNQIYPDAVKDKLSEIRIGTSFATTMSCVALITMFGLALDSERNAASLYVLTPFCLMVVLVPYFSLRKRVLKLEKLLEQDV